MLKHKWKIFCLTFFSGALLYLKYRGKRKNVNVSNSDDLHILHGYDVKDEYPHANAYGKDEDGKDEDGKDDDGKDEDVEDVDMGNQTKENYCKICFCTGEEIYSINACNHHKFCQECIISILDKYNGRINSLTCPAIDCPNKDGIDGECLDSLVDAGVLDQLLIDKFNNLKKVGDVDVEMRSWCPSCRFFQARESKESNEVECQDCKFVYCRFCQVEWHTGLSCHEYLEEDENHQLIIQSSKPCPQCSMPTVHAKFHGCHHLVCDCTYEWCYACSQAYGDCKDCETSCNDDCDCPTCEECSSLGVKCKLYTA
jgi:hypothetical protein